MIGVATVIKQRLDTATEYGVYNGQAPQSAAYPYAVYKLTQLPNTEQDRDDYALEVSCWDKSSSTSHVRVMTLAESIRQALLRYRFNGEWGEIIVTRPSVGYIPDSDAEIKRYDVTANILTYRRVQE